MIRANERAASGLSKVIAATATIAGYVHQGRQIYGVREVRRFPNRSYELAQTFYSHSDMTLGRTEKLFGYLLDFQPPFWPRRYQGCRQAEICAAINELWTRSSSRLAGTWRPSKRPGDRGDENSRLRRFMPARSLT